MLRRLCVTKFALTPSSHTSSAAGRARLTERQEACLRPPVVVGLLSPLLASQPGAQSLRLLCCTLWARSLPALACVVIASTGWLHKALQDLKAPACRTHGCWPVSRVLCMHRAAVAAFAGTLHCGLSGGVSLAVGPLGRQAEVTMQVRHYLSRILS